MVKVIDDDDTIIIMYIHMYAYVCNVWLIISSLTYILYVFDFAELPELYEGTGWGSMQPGVSWRNGECAPLSKEIKIKS